MFVIEGLNVLSLFDGISCGQIALEKAGIKVEKYFASEIKPHAIKITNYNYPNTIQIGDVTKVKYKNGILYTENGDFKTNIDIIIGGSPCQSISLVNRKDDGIYSGKSELFFEYLRILKEVNPKYFLLENVVGRKSSVEAITEYMGVEPININSSLVSAQQRRRLYWTNIPKIIIPENKNIYLKDTQTIEGDNDEKLYVTTKFQQHCKRKIEENSRWVTCNENKAQCLLAGGVNKWNCTVFKTEKGYRKPSVQECEMWQTVPVGYVSNIPNIADSKKYDVLGDGWTIDVIAHIFKGLKNT